MPVKLNPKYKKSKHNKGFMLDPNSLIAEQKAPLDLKVMESITIIEGHLEQFKFTDTDGQLTSACWVSTSRGKDSVVLEHLVLQALKNLGMKKIPHILSNTLNLYPEEIKYWKLINRRFGLVEEETFLSMIPPKIDGKQITVKLIREKNGTLENFRGKYQKFFNDVTKRFAKQTEPDCCYQLKFKSVNEYLKSDKGKYLKCSFDGRRAAESQNRSRTILQRCRSYLTKHKRPREIQTCLPMGFWTDDDIHNYMTKNLIPLCPSYEIHKLDRMGCRDCTAYKSWLIKELQDPTGMGISSARRNLEFMKKTEPERMYDLIEYTVRQKEIHKLDFHKDANKVLDEFRNQKTLEIFPIA